jgi:hypothetical protein
MKVYLVLHHEIFQRGPNEYIADDVVFHVASSIDKALAYIKEVHVDPYSWWEVQEQVVDSMDDPKHIGWYGRRGGKLKRQPFAKSVEVFKKCKADPCHHLNG